MEERVNIESDKIAEVNNGKNPKKSGSKCKSKYVTSTKNSTGGVDTHIDARELSTDEIAKLAGNFSHFRVTTVKSED